MFHEGQQIGSYTLIRKLGKGGFGEVWLAEKRSQFITKRVAVKLPLDEQVNFDAIRQEAELWEQASGHANVLPIIDADIYDGQVVIVSEYANGGSLHDKLKAEGKLPIKQAVEMTIGILNGLEFLHNKHIIHRDIKPQNILLQGETPRLGDFGISRAMQTTAISSTIIGTDAYMSPEAFDGKRSVQTDIWSVGVVLYQLLAGSLPFPNEHPSERMFAILTKTFAPLSDEVPSELKKIVDKALAKQPENRYQTTTEMREDLQKALIGIAHPTLAKTEILHIPTAQKTFTELATVENKYETDETEKETVISHTPVNLPAITQPAIQQESVVTQLKQVNFTENKPLPTEAEKLANRPSTTNPNSAFSKLGVAVFVGIFALMVVIIGAIYLSIPLNFIPSKNSSNANSSSTPLMNIEVKTLGGATLDMIIDDKESKTDFGTSTPKTYNFTAQKSFVMRYSVYHVDKFQLTINGKVIKLSKTPPLGDSLSKFEVTKDNLDQILQSGKISQ